MRFLAMVQARCGSTRLPNKVLMDLAGKPALQRTVERVQQSKYLDEVIVVTSINKENMSIIKLCCELNIRIFIGSEDDVLDRFYQAAKLIEPEYVVRITADCPLYDASCLDLAIEQLESDIDYIAQLDQETFPDGLDIEIIRFSALKRAWDEARLQSEREHVTQYIRKNRGIFKLKEIKCPLGNLGNERWTLDEAKDYQMLSAVYKHFVAQGNEYPKAEEVLAFLNCHPDIHGLNREFKRNEGLLKSLENDKKL